MSVGFLKRLLKITNICAVLAIGLTVWSYLAHREEMRKPWQPPDFKGQPVILDGRRMLIDNTTIALGAFPKPIETKPTVDTKPKEMEFKAALDKMGSIKSAVVLGEQISAMLSEAMRTLTPAARSSRTLGMEL